MKINYTLVSLLFLFFIFLIINDSQAQDFDGQWTCDYATIDDQPNATGYNTPAVGVIKENTFVALVRRGTNQTCYLVGYTNADSINGRMGYYAYGGAIGGYRQPWISGFQLVEMLEAVDLTASPDSFVYVANNDVERNILVFRMSADSVVSTDYRMATGVDSIWAIDLDGNGNVYVTQTGSAAAAGKVLIYKGIKDDPSWSSTYDATPLQTITAPEAGELRGVTVNKDGTVLYVSNYTTKKIYCYTGSPAAGYTRYTGFDFTLTDTKIAASGDTLRPGPWGLNFMNDKNILFVACDVSFQLGIGYEYGRYYLLNPNTGAILDTIDCAQWNYDKTGSYSNRVGGTQGDVSGYASTYNVDFDESYKVYTQSYYGWTVDKWSYSKTIPTIPLTIVSSVKRENIVPDKFNLAQNFPNPFNPTTTIEFSLTENAKVTLSVYSISGELVTTLINSADMEKGTYQLTFDASKLASGNYIYSLKAGGKKLTKIMTLIK